MPPIVRNTLRNSGYGVVTLGLCLIVLPFIPRNDGTAMGHTPGRIVGALVVIAVGAGIIYACRSRPR
ncbi:hypothetical protein [Phycicoccus flavus]|uniref:hypothetical protein n=1 Tax=Phycicoccus flavus TaxID=2502783 RepID=UPI000FEB74C7|nr:hypothetical protein [Phycicoccus flavus]NHA69123.1 hypothetical protein [Phycicoccus flavus]